MNLNSQLLKFQEAYQAKDLFEAWDDLVRHYRAENEGKNFTYASGKTLAEKNQIIHDTIEGMVKAQTGQMFSEHAWRSSTGYREHSMAIVSALIDAQIPDTVDSTFGQFAETRSEGFGTSFVFDVEPNDLFLVTKVGRGRRHVFGQRQYNGQVTLNATPRMITVEEDLYRILCNKGNLAKYAMKVMRSFETEIANDIYAAVNNTFASLPTEFKENSFAQDSFITLVERVRTWNGGMNAAVFGTKLALSKVVPSNDYFKMQLGEEYNRTGYLGRYMGVDLFEIKQVAVPNSPTWAMGRDDTRLYVISTGADKLVKVCYEGGTISYSDGTYQNSDLKQRNTMMKSWVVALVSSAKFGIIDIA